ncbi:hypothetical protein [Rhizobium sp. Leaf384]|uniref:hypothetical protein n=1 Tax=Rhizobium sp. Leaf384 TaxID=1736358 RepID=UPI0012E81A13|nr:hypothetical protein [Rhizobium sp. Leaf384]
MTGFPTPSISYRWYRDGFDTGVTASTYPISAADLGLRIDLAVVATNASGSMPAYVTGSTVGQGGGVPVTPLGPTTASFTAGASAGTLIAAITGLSAGETVTAVTPNDGRLAIAGGGTQLVTGLSASSAGSIAATLTTSAGRTLSVAITVNAAGASPYRFAATRLRFPTVTGTFPAAGNYQIASFFFGSPAYDVTEPRFFMPTFYQLTTGANPSEIIAPNSFNLEGVSIKVGGVWYAVPNASFTIDPSTESCGYLLDPIPGLTIPANSLIEGRVAFNGATGATMIGVSRANLMGEVAGGSSTSLAAKLTDGSAITQSNAVARQYIPAFMVAKGGDGRPVFLLAGDSIQAGANANGASFGLLSPRGNVGYWQSGLDDNTGSKRLAYGTLALEGSRPGDWSTRANWARKLDAVKKVTTANGGVPPFTQIGSNHGNNSINAADLYATVVAFWQLLKAEFPGIPIHHSELLSRPTSTDGFQSLANQNVAAVDTYNGGVAAGMGQRFVFNEKVGKGALLGDPTAQARVDGWIASSFAPWRIYAYDTGVNRDKLSIIAGAYTLAADVASGATVFTLTDVTNIQQGDMVGVNYVAAGAASFDSIVTAVNTGTKQITLASGATQAFTANTPVNPMWNSRDGLHPGLRAHNRIALEAVVPWKVAQGWV